MRRIMCLALVSLAVGLWLLPANAIAVTEEFTGLVVDFHGHLESKTIARNEAGFQYGFDKSKDWALAQQLLEGQFDFTVKPAAPSQFHGLYFEKAFIRVRNHYDAVFDLTEHWEPINDSAQGVAGHSSTNKFDYGRDDIKWENDIREIFVDLSARPFGSNSNLNVRVGRQIVQWGESDGFNVVNQVNPNDNRWMMFFSNPEDLLLPVYMLRTDLSLPGAGPFSGFNIQALVIPDNRPNLLAPSADGNYKSPYAFLFPELGFGPGTLYPDPMTNGITQFTPTGVPMYDNTPDDTFRDMNFGVRLGTEIGGWQMNGYYLYQYQHAPAINLSHFADMMLPGGPAGYAAATLDHPRTHMFGFSFNKFIEYGGFVLRGEGSYTKDGTQFDLNNVLDNYMAMAMAGSPAPAAGTGYSKHDVWEGVIGFDKQWSNIHLWTDSALITNFQAFYRHINNWDEDQHQILFGMVDYGTRATQDRLRFSFMALTDYVHGTVKPLVFVAYEPTGQWMTNASVEYCPDGHWYVTLNQMSFWGNTSYHFDPLTDFQPLIKSASEVGLKVGYRW